jgi:hypothetical protein
MTKIALTAAAILIATGSAFASSDEYGNHGSRNAGQPAASQSILIENSHTASIRKSDAPVQKPVFGADRELFGN